MGDLQAMKEKLLQELDELSEHRLQEVLNFAEGVKRKEMENRAALDPQADPILRLIGIAEVEPFAHTIDHELYGE